MQTYVSFNYIWANLCVWNYITLLKFTFTAFLITFSIIWWLSYLHFSTKVLICLRLLVNLFVLYNSSWLIQWAKLLNCNIFHFNSDEIFSSFQVKLENESLDRPYFNFKILLPDCAQNNSIYQTHSMTSLNFTWTVFVYLN